MYQILKFFDEFVKHLMTINFQLIFSYLLEHLRELWHRLLHNLLARLQLHRLFSQFPLQIQCLNPWPPERDIDFEAFRSVVDEDGISLGSR